MIKIFYDHQKFSTQRYGGISRYFANLIQALESLPEFDYLLGVIYSQNHYIKDKMQVSEMIGKWIKNPNYYAKLNKIYCEYLIKKNNFDVFHPTYYDTYFLKNLKKPLVITIHDMIYERFPEYFWAKDPLISLKRQNIERADQIIAISETTKDDLIKYSDVDESKIKVIYHGMDLTAPFISSPVDGAPEKYILFVGDRSGYKNFYLFVNAFQKIALKYPEIKLVLAGGGNLDIAEIEYLRILKISDKVKHTNASDTELNFLYQQALAFVYPSLYEGFGLPVLEAYRAKCPLILSDTKPFREIARDTAIYFDPQSVDEMVSAIDKVISSEDLRQSLIKRGLNRLMDFSLEKSLLSTLNVYKELA